MWSNTLPGLYKVTPTKSFWHKCIVPDNWFGIPEWIVNIPNIQWALYFPISLIWNGGVIQNSAYNWPYWYVWFRICNHRGQFMSFTGYALIYQVGLTVDPTQACNALKWLEITKFQVWSFSLLITALRALALFRFSLDIRARKPWWYGAIFQYSNGNLLLNSKKIYNLVLFGLNQTDKQIVHSNWYYH